MWLGFSELLNTASWAFNFCSSERKPRRVYGALLLETQYGLERETGTKIRDAIEVTQTCYDMCK